MIRNLLILGFISIGITACGALMRSEGKTCVGELYTQQNAKLGARTQATIGKEISFCKGGTFPQVISLQMPSSQVWPDSVLTMNTIHEVNQDGEIRYDGSCNDNGRKKWTSEYTPVALTSKSFREFKLCYYDQQKTKIALSLISENEPCPQGSVPQEFPVDDCSKL